MVTQAATAGMTTSGTAATKSETSGRGWRWRLTPDKPTGTNPASLEPVLI